MKILLIAGSGKSTNYLYNGLDPEFSIGKVIIEEPVSKWSLIKRRIKNLGLLKVLGQVFFISIAPAILRLISKDRISELEEIYFLSSKEIPQERVKKVSSVNSDECMQAIKDYQPDLILVNGTRIISSIILGSTKAPFINIHVGITPKYRGVHGGYWALIHDDPENCGVTIHYVDKGIDTGGVIAQTKISINSNDNFITYPIHQYGVGIKLFRDVIHRIKSGEVVTGHKPEGDSNLFYHPTITEYLFNRVIKNIK